MSLAGRPRAATRQSRARTIRKTIAVVVAFVMTPVVVLMSGQAAATDEDASINGTLTMPDDLGIGWCDMRATAIAAYGDLTVTTQVEPSSGNGYDRPFQIAELGPGTYSVDVTCYVGGEPTITVFLADLSGVPVLVDDTEENESTYSRYAVDTTSPPVLNLSIPDPNAALASVTVTDPAQQALPHAVVTTMVYDDQNPDPDYYEQAVTDSNGLATVELPGNEDPFTLRVSAPGRAPIYLYENSDHNPAWSSSAPAMGDAWTSLTGADADLTAQLGAASGAWQELPGCRDNTLSATDDDSTDFIPVPNGGTLTYFGTTYTGLYVNNNGNVTFGQPSEEWTPSFFTSDDDDEESAIRPMDEPSDEPTDAPPTTDLPADEIPRIAPFWSDVETNVSGSDVVTYGWNPAGTTFCVDWSNVAPNGGDGSDLDTFQLILTKTGDASSGTDFTVTFGYGDMSWDQDGDALAGFTAGTQAVGTYLQLPGNEIAGAMLDGGDYALSASSNVTPAVPGRYTFQPGVDYTRDLPVSVEGGTNCEILAYLPDHLDGAPAGISVQADGLSHLSGLDPSKKYIFAAFCGINEDGPAYASADQPLEANGVPCITFTTGERDSTGAFVMTSDPEEAGPIDETVGDLAADPDLTDAAGNAAGPTLNVRSAEDIEPGTNSLSGTVYNDVIAADTKAPQGTWVYACNEDDWYCYPTQVDANGGYTFTGLPDGWYMVDAYLNVEPWDAGDEVGLFDSAEETGFDLDLQPCYFQIDRAVLHLAKTAHAKVPTTKLPRGTKLVVKWYVGKKLVGTGRTLTLKKAWVGKKLHYTVAETWTVRHHTEHVLRSSKPVTVRR